MGLTFYIFVFLVIWWTVLFAVLPLGSKSHHEAGMDVPGGGEPASPVDPQLKKKFITTTWISVVCLALLALVLELHLVSLPQIPQAPNGFH